MSYFDTFGTLRYSPKLLGNEQSKFWVILECDKEIGKYYRHLYSLLSYRCNKLCRPAWADHVVIVREEEPPDTRFWNRFAGIDVALRVFTNKIETNGYYFWFPVFCETACVLRAKLGLKREPQVPFHLSIGHAASP